MVDTKTCRRERIATSIARIDGERQRLGRDLHDGSMPYLTAAICGTEAIVQELRGTNSDCAERLSQVSALLQRVAAELRHTIRRRAGEMTDGLEVALSDFLQSVVKTQDVATDLEYDHSIFTDEAVAFQVLRIAQEASQNALKHANASRIAVSVTRCDHDIVMEIADDGRGIDAAARHGVGIDSMVRRAQLLQGSLRIERNGRGGTTVTLRFPFDTSLLPQEKIARPVSQKQSS